jgi:ATP-binding cassette subfamily B protein
MRAVAERFPLLRPLADAPRALLLALLALLLVESLLPAATALVLGELVGRVSGSTEAANLLLVALAPLMGFALVLLLGHVFEAVKGPMFYLATVRIDGAYRERVARMASTSPTIEALERPDVQDLIREAKADPESWTQRTYADGALSQLGLIAAATGLVGSCAVLARYAWWPIPLLLACSIAFRALDRRQGVAWYQMWRKGMVAGRYGETWNAALQSPGEGKEARVFGFGPWAVDRIQHYMRLHFEPVWALGGGQIRGRWRQGLLVAVPLGVTLVSVAVGAAGGHVDVAVELAVFSAAVSVTQVARWNDPRDVVGARESARAYSRLVELLGNGVDTGQRTVPGAGAVPALPPVVRFEDVSFRYPGSERLVLDGLWLEIRPGELLAIVGLNGAGKSTVLKLLAGLYRPTGGRITSDGVDLASIPPTDWRERIAVVFQDFVRYELSAEDNVALGHASVPLDDAALRRAAADAGLEPVVAGLPLGWRTPLARSRTDGVDLSGGQWQQVVLARALYAVRTGARLLVLDEPTAHLDVRTEFDVFGRLAAHRGDASVVLISHRLSTVRQADRIVLLDAGRIAEDGSHDELVARGGAYAEMFAIQAERFQRGYDDRIEEAEFTG